MPTSLRLAFALFVLLSSKVFAQLPAGNLVSVRDGCPASSCDGRHAIVFVHGIFGGAETFTNTDVSPSFEWPTQVPLSIAGSPIDVYRIEYKTALLTWARQDIASLDEVIDAIYPRLSSLRTRGYSSVNFVAHSLGGNVVTAYLHSVKSEEGHVERARHGFVMTLGTPANGASIANVGLLLKSILQMPDPLLSSLTKDNTFLRMMKLWARQEDVKVAKFRCRPIHFYAGVESKPIGPIQVVDAAAAANELPRMIASRTFAMNHSEIAKPQSTQSEQYVWFLQIAQKEIERVNAWGPKRLCDKEM